MRSLQTGTTKWKEGTFEVVDSDSKVTLVVRYSAGGIPKIFQLNHNIKNVVVRPNRGKLSCLMVTLKDSSFLTVDKIPSKDADEMRLYLEAVQNRFHTAAKSTQGSSSFGGILGNRTTQKDSNRQFQYIENQTPTKKTVVENKDDTPLRKVLASPGRAAIKNSGGTGISGNRVSMVVTPATSTPHRSGLLENRERRKRAQPTSEMNEDYPKENDSSSNNKAMTDPARKFLCSSREKQLNLKQAEENRTSGFCLTRLPPRFMVVGSSTKDYSASNSNLDRSNVG
uniref:Ubiquitin carboxyl-terminal hydrolase 37 n=1 Tax=Sphaerodactylus townsendi TaxID=933632 RepID=A0ACB8G231_9SAUR